MFKYERNVQYNLLYSPSIFGSVHSILVSHHDLLSVHIVTALLYFTNMKVNLSVVERNCSFEHGTGSCRVHTGKLLLKNIGPHWRAAEVSQVSEQM